MAQRNNWWLLARPKCQTVETLGSTTVICSDKTGTLTENQMTVQELFAGGRLYQVTGGGYEPKGEILFNGATAKLPEHPALAECLRAGVLCNESQLVREDGRLKLQGDPTEAALLVAAEKGGIIRADAHHQTPVLDTIPFESEHMFRATLHEAHQGRVIYKVGALERLLERCTDALGERNALVPLVRDAVHRAAETMAARGLRVLALARRHVDTAITAQARRLNADLIVLGTHGHSGLKRALLGSVAERVVRHAPCPVLTVRAKGK